MEKLKTAWDYIKIFSLIIAVSLGAHWIGQYRTEVKYETIQTETKAKEEFIEKETLKKEKEELQKEVKKAQVKINPTELVSVKKYYLLLKHGDGRYELRTGGSPSWRYNNPGKLAYGNFTKMAGAVGKDGPLALFPDYDTGRAAFESYIFETDVYKGMSVSKMVFKFAQIKDGYDPKKYLEAITKGTKYKAGTLLSDFTADDRAELIEKIQEQENWIAGNIRHFDNKEHFEKEGY